MADNVTTEDLEQALNDLAESMGLSVKEYVEGGFLDLTTYGQDKAAILARLDAIDVINDEDDVETLAEKIAAINAVLSDDEGALQGILDLIKVNKADIATLRSDMTGITDGLRTDVDNAIAKGNSNESAISDLSGVVSDYKTANDERVSNVEGRITDTEAAIDTLNGAADLEGSVAYAVAQEEARTKTVIGLRADLETTETGTIVGAINEVNGKAGVAQTSANAAMDKATANEEAIALLNADEDTEGSVAYAIKEVTGGDLTDLSDRMDATEAATATNASAIGVLNGDAETEGSVDYKIAQAANESNAVTDALSDRIDANDSKLAVLNGGVDTEGSVDAKVAAAKTELSDSIATEIAAREEADATLAARTQTVEDILNDTTDEDDNLVKGIVTRVGEAEAAIVAERDARIAELEAAVADMKAYSDANDLKAASMDICSIGNKFRGALGLGDTDCGGDSGDGEAV